MLVGYSSSSEEEEESLAVKKRKSETLLNDSASDLKRPKFTPTPLESRTFQQQESGARSPRRPGESDEVPSPGRHARLPVPGSVLDMFRGSEEEALPDPSRHGGRMRSFGHERGNWATYVYLPYSPDESFLELVELLARAAQGHGVVLKRADEFHISLSQTVVLRHHWIDPFVLSLKKELANCQKFMCVADRVNVYSNQEKSRTFLGVEVSAGHPQLLEVVRTIDRTLQEFRLSTFYQKPSFHVSLAWCVGDYTETLRGMCCQELQTILDKYEDGAFQLTVPCEEIRCKSGNKFFSFPLR
ncbi:USB1 phosphodiesterase, partial [Atractosteus spatula]|nr:USB1 phosphodiesterase [Atractosteus spatula]